jgi:Arc/MetJ-type ribon-helix-helix transcriptional regulator
MRKSEQLAVRLSAEKLGELDEVVKRGGFQSRAEALRAGLDLLLARVRERQIADEYESAYGAAPTEDWVGEAGAELAAEVIAGERGSKP